MRNSFLFFKTKTRSVAKPSKDYLHGQLFTLQKQNMTQYVKEVPESDYESMQHFISNSPWDEDGALKQLQHDVCDLLGSPTSGAIILDESGISKQGNMSVGVQRQYNGRLGKVDNCQVGVFLAYANETNVTLIDRCLYLPKSWTKDPCRRKKCGIPEETTFKTKAELGLEMILKFKEQGHPFGWVGFDAHYGEQPWFLKSLNEGVNGDSITYMADIPCTTRIFLERPRTEIPDRKGSRGRHPTKEKLVDGEMPPIEVREHARMLQKSDWSRLEVRDTERGSLIADFYAVPVYHAVDNLPFQKVWLIIRREVASKEIKFSFSNSSFDTSLERLASMQSRRYWVERALQNAKGEAGLAQYQVRGWVGWHHHMTMTLLAMLFLLELVFNLREDAPLLTIQDVREILERFLPRKDYSPAEFKKLLEKKHKLEFKRKWF
jgi:SRSO17 transposase